MDPVRPGWATSTDTEGGVDEFGRPVHAHYSNEQGEATLARFDTITDEGAEIGATFVMLWLGSDSITASRLDVEQLRKLARDLDAVADSIDAHLELAVAEIEWGQR